MKNEMKTLIIGSRGSQLALWQAHWVKSELEKHFGNLQIDVNIIKTTGDKNLESPLSQIGDKGLFTKEIEHALLDRKIDLAVHSLKDLPTMLPPGLIIGAITKREDVHDVFISHPKKQYKHFVDVPLGAKIATGSLRRKSQLLNWRPDIEVIDLRGNLNTRFAKLDASDWDGMILARAGVVRLEMGGRIVEDLPFEKMLPAVGQGALAIEISEEDHAIAQVLKPLVSEATTIAVTGERALLRLLEGGCQVPIGTHAYIESNTFMMDGMIGSLNGRKIVRGRIHGTPSMAEELGKTLARTLLEGGGKEILDRIRSSTFIEEPNP
jgi:hydroxymethylbilane synthase